MHPTKPEIADGTHAQILDADGPKRALGGADSRADLRQVQRLIVVDCQQLLEAHDDCGVADSAPSSFNRDTFVEAHHNGVHKCLLQRPCRLGLREGVGCALRELVRGLLEIQ